MPCPLTACKPLPAPRRLQGSQGGGRPEYLMVRSYPQDYPVPTNGEARIKVGLGRCGCCRRDGMPAPGAANNLERMHAESTPTGGPVPVAA